VARTVVGLDIGTTAVRAAEVSVRRGQVVLEYLYLTDFEALDPESGYHSNPATATAQCSRYWWQNRPLPPTCVRISFVTGDEINGPMHTNDTISVNGTPHFNGKATTGWSGTLGCTPRTGFTFRWYGVNNCNDRPVFQSGDPTTDSLTLPTTNTALKAETDRSVGKTGCLYTGPTRIVLNAAGTMTVTPANSPFETEFKVNRLAEVRHPPACAPTPTPPCLPA
jgi:hypothetical protein